MKVFKIIGLCIISLIILSCTDDVKEVEPLSISPPAINPDSRFALDRSSYSFTAGLGSRVSVEGVEGYQFVLIGNGLTAINGVLDGRGEIVQLVLFNTDPRTGVSGTYSIRDTQADGTAQLVYSLNFDSSIASDADDSLATGTVIVEELANNEIRITITDAMTEDGMQDFTLFFEGGILSF
jgi:hypothetical protein